MKRVMLLINVYKMGFGKSFPDQSEPVKRDLRAYNEDWETINEEKSSKNLYFPIG